MDLEDRYRIRPSRFRLAEHDTADTAGFTREGSRKHREKDLERLDELQERLYAESRQALLVVFQAMDAAGKDGTIEHVMSGVNPQGVRVTSFKRPSELELSHDWLWRCSAALPSRGEIGIFNRSHYEEVLVVRVHRDEPTSFWDERLEDIAAWERHLQRSGTRVVKFFLHVSRAEQRKRFLSRAAEPDKHWKFSAADIAERRHWDAYMDAFEHALRATSSKHAPWYAIPADHKWFMRTAVAAILVHHLRAMDPRYPAVTEEQRAAMAEAVKALEAEDG